MNSPSIPLSERSAADPAALVEVKSSELEAVNGGAVVLTTATDYVNQIMKNVPPSNGNPDGYPDGCGTPLR